jgi:metal-dependent HD superfamily phosphatase/phosphodiesterase
MQSFESIRKDGAIRTYIEMADQSLEALGFTEHRFAHVLRVAEQAAELLRAVGYDERMQELTKIAGYLHDIGNLVNRHDHSQSGAILAFHLLSERGFSPEEIAPIVSAIGNHDEGSGSPVSPMAAALILADKSDVRRSRVRDVKNMEWDIHDRVNYSVTDARLHVENGEVSLSLTIDTSISSVMEYFEIFTERMLLCRKAATVLGLRFRLYANGQPLI